MAPEQYKTARKKRGTQAEIAARLGLARNTIIRRERGALPITREAALAILALPLISPKDRPPRA